MRHIAVGQVWERRGKMYLVTAEPIVRSVTTTDDEILAYAEVPLLELETGQRATTCISTLVLSLEWSLLG